MKSQDLKKYALPDEPGVYYFLARRSLLDRRSLGKVGGEGGSESAEQILYIGKATSLKDRVKSYFAGDLGDTRGPRLVKMLELADKIKWQATGSVLEALLLETELIKKHQPIYNAREKDDKSYNYVVITKETYPRILIVRGATLFPIYNLPYTISNFYGPFPNGRDLKIALRLIRKIFPWRDRCLPAGVLPLGKTPAGNPCFEHQIGLCPGVCTGEISAKDYAKIIAKLRLIFSGHFSALKKKLEREMKAVAKNQAFEQAGALKKQLFALNHLQDVALLSHKSAEAHQSSLRLEAYDIAHLSGTNTVGGLVVWQDGELSPPDYRRFKIKNLKSGQVDDLKNLAEILTRRLDHLDWPRPDLIIVDGDERIRQVAGKVIQAQGLLIPVVAVTKDAHHKAVQLLGPSDLIRDYRRAIILTNAEAHRYTLAFHRKLRGQLLK